MASLAVRCKACGAQVGTRIRTGWVASPRLGPHMVPCTACGARATYVGSEFVPA